MSSTREAFLAALLRAEAFIGATSPNPAVGAVALDASGEILSVQAHEKAGQAHAEAKVIEDCRARGLLPAVDTLLVTLEPCNHVGRTPPCTRAILEAGIRRVIYGARDPNPRVPGGGAEVLRRAGVEVLTTDDPEISVRCAKLIRTFSHWSTTGLPWVTVKTAHTASGSMIPPDGQKTFTSSASLLLAHALRKRADAIITGSGTILADQPEFTVRHLSDHPGKSRWLVVLDRRRRVPREWIERAEGRGFRVVMGLPLGPALEWLGKQGALEALVEAGPAVSGAVLSGGHCNEHVVITQVGPNQEDRIEFRA